MYPPNVEGMRKDFHLAKVALNKKKGLRIKVKFRIL